MIAYRFPVLSAPDRGGTRTEPPDERKPRTYVVEVDPEPMSDSTATSAGPMMINTTTSNSNSNTTAFWDHETRSVQSVPTAAIGSIPSISDADEFATSGEHDGSVLMLPGMVNMATTEVVDLTHLQGPARQTGGSSSSGHLRRAGASNSNSTTPSQPSRPVHSNQLERASTAARTPSGTTQVAATDEGGSSASAGDGRDGTSGGRSAGNALSSQQVGSGGSGGDGPDDNNPGGTSSSGAGADGAAASGTPAAPAAPASTGRGPQGRTGRSLQVDTSDAARPGATTSPEALWKRFLDARVADIVPERVWRRCGPFLHDWWTEYPLWLSVAVDISTALVLAGVILGCLYIAGGLGPHTTGVGSTITETDEAQPSSGGAGDPAAGSTPGGDAELSPTSSSSMENNGKESAGDHAWVLPAVIGLSGGGLALHLTLLMFNRERFSVLMMLARDYYEGSRLEASYLRHTVPRNRDGSPMAISSSGAGGANTPATVRPILGSSARQRFQAYTPHCMAVATVGNPLILGSEEWDHEEVNVENEGEEDQEDEDAWDEHAIPEHGDETTNYELQRSPAEILDGNVEAGAGGRPSSSSTSAGQGVGADDQGETGGSSSSWVRSMVPASLRNSLSARRLRNSIGIPPHILQSTSSASRAAAGAPEGSVRDEEQGGTTAAALALPLPTGDNFHNAPRGFNVHVGSSQSGDGGSAPSNIRHGDRGSAGPQRNAVPRGGVAASGLEPRQSASQEAPDAVLPLETAPPASPASESSPPSGERQQGVEVVGESAAQGEENQNGPREDATTAVTENENDVEDEEYNVGEEEEEYEGETEEDADYEMDELGMPWGPDLDDIATGEILAIRASPMHPIMPVPPRIGAKIAPSWEPGTKRDADLL